MLSLSAGDGFRADRGALDATPSGTRSIRVQPFQPRSSRIVDEPFGDPVRTRPWSRPAGRRTGRRTAVAAGLTGLHRADHQSLHDVGDLDDPWVVGRPVERVAEQAVEPDHVGVVQLLVLHGDDGVDQVRHLGGDHDPARPAPARRTARRRRDRAAGRGSPRRSAGAPGALRRRAGRSAAVVLQPPDLGAQLPVDLLDAVGELLRARRRAAPAPGPAARRRRPGCGSGSAARPRRRRRSGSPEWSRSGSGSSPIWW